MAKNLNVVDDEVVEAAPSKSMADLLTELGASTAEQPAEKLTYSMNRSLEGEVVAQLNALSARTGISRATLCVKLLEAAIAEAAKTLGA